MCVCVCTPNSLSERKTQDDSPNHTSTHISTRALTEMKEKDASSRLKEDISFSPSCMCALNTRL